MASGFGRFARRARAAGSQGADELRQVFDPWLDLPEAFGAPRRRRLFFPLANVLDVSIAGPVGGRDVPGCGEEVSGVAGD